MNNQPTWLHTGLGSFHRAHQVWYLHRLIASGDKRWHIAAGNVRNDAEQVVQALAVQGRRYVLETVSPEGERNYEEITSIQKLLPWQVGLQPLINKGTDPQTKVIAFTVTEGGYYLNIHHQLETSNPDLQIDLRGECKTIYGTLARILEECMADDVGPLTLFNCDNVRHNGERFHSGMVEFLQFIGKQAMINWMAINITRLNTMVDRIIQRPAVDLSARIKVQTGIDDRTPAMEETFIQWVAENHLRDAHSNLEVIGVEMVESAIPYEEAKTRILNALHSCIAWVRILTDQQYIHESTPTDAIYAIVDRYVMENVIPCLGGNGIDLLTYRDVVLKHFTNPYVQGTNQRVVADGFSKIPATIAPTLQECYQRDVHLEATAMLPALFLVFMEQWHKGTLSYQYQDGILDTQVVYEMYEAQDPMAVCARDEALLGDLANNTDFLVLMREKVAVVYTLIK